MSEPARAVEGATFTMYDQEITILPKCDDDAGYWLCTTHGESFSNNFAKDSHLGSAEGTCVLAWGCFAHGVEVP